MSEVKLYSKKNFHAAHNQHLHSALMSVSLKVRTHTQLAASLNKRDIISLKKKSEFKISLSLFNE
jgi:hypothetical protein